MEPQNQNEINFGIIGGRDHIKIFFIKPMNAITAFSCKSAKNQIILRHTDIMPPRELFEKVKEIEQNCRRYMEIFGYNRLLDKTVKTPYELIHSNISSVIFSE